MIIWRMRIAAEGYKHTLTKYVILIAVQLQQLLHKSVSMLRYTCIASLFFFYRFIYEIMQKGIAQPDRPGTTV
jgi:hypothetical protein